MMFLKKKEICILFWIVLNGINLEIYIIDYQKLNKNDPIKEEIVTKIFIQNLKSLKCIHDCQIIHRDIKPDNILITNKFEVKITDFGIATFQRENENINYGDDNILFGNNTRTGRADYVFPKYLLVLGLTIFNLMTSKFPFILKVDRYKRYYIEPCNILIDDK